MTPICLQSNNLRIGGEAEALATDERQNETSCGARSVLNKMVGRLKQAMLGAYLGDELWTIHRLKR